ncbi:hypothetical protein GE21DRAFT_7519 [Neurospora crassa]|uniref:Uncharacterized protein n=2 Tax=Neurospora crassa TaxID=5141 RepID=Q1K879_NEUCR|nr:hypothetical protein NCU01096 [Neurospora crassa OR74A]EAA32472.1 hypothetical protein NCU01096 [Neurospora crassa OR74A]KHE88280.1 hypothetical protein GE21DRAFT_7519 [Neurospora crassa]CAD21346.1 hypothetical protein [Neurospora crassa]|eukprot:XP_961708.1 hypothetical protein NCU01096 [Neurospora crassa OR74A]
MARPQNCSPLCLPEMRLVDRWQKCQEGGTGCLCPLIRWGVMPTVTVPSDTSAVPTHTDEEWRDRLRDSRENEMQRVNAGHDLTPNAIVAYWAGTCRSCIEGPLEEAPQGTEPFAMS